MTQQRRSTDHPDSKRSRRTVVVVAVVAAVAVMLAFAAAGFALWLNAGRTSDVAQLAQQIQDERASNILRSCLQTNARHDAAIGKLNAFVDAIPDPARRERARRNIASSVAVIQAIVPRDDCAARVRSQVDTK